MKRATVLKIAKLGTEYAKWEKITQRLQLSALGQWVWLSTRRNLAILQIPSNSFDLLWGAFGFSYDSEVQKQFFSGKGRSSKLLEVNYSKWPIRAHRLQITISDSRIPAHASELLRHCDAKKLYHSRESNDSKALHIRRSTTISDNHSTKPLHTLAWSHWLVATLIYPPLSRQIAHRFSKASSRAVELSSSCFTRDSWAGSLLPRMVGRSFEIFWEVSRSKPGAVSGKKLKSGNRKHVAARNGNVSNGKTSNGKVSSGRLRTTRLTDD